MIRPIHPGLSPNVEREDFLFALNRIVRVDTYLHGKETEQLAKWFEKKYGGKAFPFTSGRGALSAILRGVGIGSGDEVLVTGFTCVAVVDGVLAVGAKPVYVDMQKDFTLIPGDVRKKITKKTKAIILQHTFGISNATKEVLQIAKEHKLFVIEDMAHGIGITDKEKLLGTFGDATLFSLGRDKAFSSVSGGVALVRNNAYAEKVAAFYNAQNEPSRWWIFQQLFHIVSFFALILPFYDIFSLGKIFLVFFQKVGLLTKPIDKKELDHFSLYTQKFPAALSAVALNQLQRLEKFNAIRRRHVAYYEKALQSSYPELLQIDAPLLRFPLLVEHPVALKKFARKHGVYLGDWYSNSIDPKGTDVASCYFDAKNCPQAAEVARHIVNLPTYPTLSQKDAEKVATIVVQYAHRQADHR